MKEAIRKADALNQDDYVDFSAVTEAIEAVEYNKDYTEQATVDGYAEAIENAVKALVLRSADYTAVDAAIAKARALNGNLYKNFSDVTAAVKAVDRNKNFKEQAEVDAMAEITLLILLVNPFSIRCFCIFFAANRDCRFICFQGSIFSR